MRMRMRFLALLLCFCLTFSTSSCILVGHVTNTMLEMAEDFTTGDGSNEQTKGPDELNEPLAYTLTDADHTEFSRLLAECEELVLQGTDVDAIEAALDAMEAQYYHIVTQAQIAYLLYSCDMLDEELSEAQLYASEMQSDAYGEYITFAQKVDESESPYREAFFSDWSEADIESMRTYTDEMTELSQENDALLVLYHELDLSDDEDLAEVETLYLDFIANNQAQADIMGYANYYEYASKSLYLRDASAAERAAFRTYVASYIIPLYNKLAAEFDALYESLSYFEQVRVYNFLFEPYNDQSTDYVFDYVASYPASVRVNMESLFDPSCSLFVDGENAYDGAYTTYLYDDERPFCYFGPGYQDSMTVAHEMGHYYAGCYNPVSDVPLDLAEVHSQANEYLFLRYLKDSLAQDIFRAIELYQVIDTCATIILATLIDDFEEYVYTHYVEILENNTPLDDVMELVCRDYGGFDMISEQVADMNLYWRYVVLDSPVYYISYALSATTALSIYEIAVEDQGAARTVYRALCEDLDVTLSFRETLDEVALPDPYAQSTFVAIRDCFS